MNFLIKSIFGGLTNAKQKDLTQCKDVPDVVLEVLKKVSFALDIVSPKLSGVVDMERVFLKMDGKPTAEAAIACNKIPQEEYTITNSKGNKLVGTLYKAEKPSNIIAFLIHGYRMTGSTEFTRYIPSYHELGINVFVIDQTGAGRSEGDYVTFGIQEALDGVQWANFLSEKFPESEIFLHGNSLGASTALLMTGSPNLPESVRFCVADSPYFSAKDEFEYILSFFHLPIKLYEPIRRAFRKESGYDLDEANAEKAVTLSKTPTLFIHGKKDVFVPFPHSVKLYYACGAETKKLSEYPLSGHCQSEFANPGLYFKDIKSFAEQCLTNKI